MEAKEDLYKDPIRTFLVGNDAHVGKLYDLKMALAKKEGEIARHMIHYEYKEAQKKMQELPQFLTSISEKIESLKKETLSEFALKLAEDLNKNVVSARNTILENEQHIKDNQAHSNNLGEDDMHPHNPGRKENVDFDGIGNSDNPFKPH